MATYNGHRSWNAWNVALWLFNDEGLYNLMMNTLRECGYDKNKTARMLMRQLSNLTTPDGARYNLTCIREALRGLEA